MNAYHDELLNNSPLWKVLQSPNRSGRLLIGILLSDLWWCVAASGASWFFTIHGSCLKKRWACQIFANAKKYPERGFDSASLSSCRNGTLWNWREGHVSKESKREKMRTFCNIIEFRIDKAVWLISILSICKSFSNLSVLVSHRIPQLEFNWFNFYKSYMFFENESNQYKTFTEPWPFTSKYVLTDSKISPYPSPSFTNSYYT